MLIPRAFSSFESVLPLINQRSSSATPRQKTFFVVRSGKTSSRRLNRICTPNFDNVPEIRQLPEIIELNRTSASPVTTENAVIDYLKTFTVNMSYIMSSIHLGEYSNTALPQRFQNMCWSAAGARIQGSSTSGRSPPGQMFWIPGNIP